MEYVIKYVGGHVEVFDSKGKFLFSADTVQEAREDIEQLMTAA